MKRRNIMIIIAAAALLVLVIVGAILFGMRNTISKKDYDEASQKATEAALAYNDFQRQYAVGVISNIQGGNAGRSAEDTAALEKKQREIAANVTKLEKELDGLKANADPDVKAAYDKYLAIRKEIYNGDTMDLRNYAEYRIAYDHYENACDDTRQLEKTAGANITPQLAQKLVVSLPPCIKAVQEAKKHIEIKPHLMPFFNLLEDHYTKMQTAALNEEAYHQLQVEDSPKMAKVAADLADKQEKTIDELEKAVDEYADILRKKRDAK